MSEQDVLVAVLDKTRIKIMEILRHWWVAIRAGLVGVGIGIIPGVGEDVASWVSYGVAKKASKHPEEYGKGSIEGLIAAETADNSCIGGAIIPLLSLGIPGSPPAAVLLGAFLIHGVRPGPMLSFEFPAFTYQAVSWLLVATLFMFILSVLIARPMQRILQIKNAILMPIVAVLCAIGSFSLDLRFIDIVLVFFAAQFVAFFNYSKLGLIIAIDGAQFLKSIGFTGITLIVAFVFVSAFINLFMGSASAKWAIMAPVFVPMFMLLDYHPALTQAAFRIGDSVTNLITPMMSYFALIVAFAQKYDEKYGIGTIISTMIPYTVILTIFWVLLLVIWMLLGLPLGPDGPLYLVK
jgi:hypothetical protein